MAIERLSGKKDKQQFKKENIAKSYTQASPPTRLGTGLCNDARQEKALSLQSQFIYSYLLHNYGQEVAQANGAASKVR